MKNFKGYTATWEMMKKVADPEELKELEAIEKRYQEKPTALNPLGQKLMKQKANPLDKVTDRIVKNHEIYDEPGPLEKKVQSGKPLTKQEKNYIKANPSPQFVDSKKIVKPKTPKLSETKIKVLIKTLLRSAQRSVLEIMPIIIIIPPIVGVPDFLIMW